MNFSNTPDPRIIGLHEVKERLNLLQPTIEATQEILLKMKAHGFLKGRSYSTLLGAALYLACRLTRTPMTIRDISSVLSLKRTLIAKQYRALVNELNLDVPSVDISNCIIRLANIINISDRTKHLAMHTLNVISRGESLAGKKPMAMAAAILYLSCEIIGEHKSQNGIAHAAGINPITLRSRLADLQKQLSSSQGKVRKRTKANPILHNTIH